MSIELPVPPIEYRRLVGLADEKYYGPSVHQPVFNYVPETAYRTIFDFGCGCGRHARRLIQRAIRPNHYLGIDRHQGMITWCRDHLTTAAPTFEFRHHDVAHPELNPGGTPGHLPLPVGDAEITLFLGVSIFTHLLEADAGFYLRELGRVLSPDGLAVTTWFLFDKQDFPMMQEFQNALMINPLDLTNAVIFDRDWLTAQAGQAGLVITRVLPPALRGFHWTVHLERRTDGRVPVTFPDDLAPRGVARAPLS